MRVVRVMYQGFGNVTKQYAHCFLLIQQPQFSVARAYEISVLEQYPICSNIHLDILIESECEKAGGDFWKAYLKAQENGYAFEHFSQGVGNVRQLFTVPKFSELDFIPIFESLGGQKIAESASQTPDFLLTDVVIELKDLQKDSLNDKDRQQRIAEVFQSLAGYTVDVNPLVDYGSMTVAYHRLIQNALQTKIGNASSQIKSYKAVHQTSSAGIIFLNTGMFSLPHHLFKKMVQDILTRRTRTVEFAFLFSQVTQTNGFDTVAVFPCEFIGAVPDIVRPITEKVKALIEEKMTLMVTNPSRLQLLASQEPISFEKNGKIFYWNPGPLPDSRFN